MKRQFMINVLRPESFPRAAIALSGSYPLPLLTRRALGLKAGEIPAERRSAPQSIPYWCTAALRRPPL